MINIVYIIFSVIEYGIKLESKVLSFMCLLYFCV